ncbi:hypothetical protein [Alkaliphilus hydrothermalis]|uniref:RNase H-like HicB family nuclease n=1 Tax=Alkaliphilus hydrothermalis TaxID=1482730 RepID=A0ABS2NU10_9FIRM|nr:hypothetical protein [Alkaliphilus hydrothermalis]MBM7616059.1 putative RNase H-like HicB family nuclease [Alkaliphilus hydrothermalis]
MNQKFMIRTENGLSDPITREEALKRVKEYAHQGVEAYIVSEDEGQRIKAAGNKFNKPTWS